MSKALWRKSHFLHWESSLHRMNALSPSAEEGQVKLLGNEQQKMTTDSFLRRERTPLLILQMAAFGNHQTPSPSATKTIPKQSPPGLLHPLATAAATETLPFPLRFTHRRREALSAHSCLFSFRCRKTTRSALSAITEQTEEAAAWFSRLWGLPFSIIFGSVTICAACVRMHVCSPLRLTHFLFPAFLPVGLSVFTPCSCFLHMIISHLFSLTGAPNPKSTIPDVYTN